MTQLVSVRFEEKTIKQAEQTYKKKITGLRVAAEGYFEIRHRTLSEMEGYFDRDQLVLLVDFIKATTLVPSLQGSKEVFLGCIEDGYRKISPGSIGGEAHNSLKAKIMSLTSAQIYFLQDAVQCLDTDDEKEYSNFISTYSRPKNS